MVWHATWFLSGRKWDATGNLLLSGAVCDFLLWYCLCHFMGTCSMITCSRHSDGRPWVKIDQGKKMERDFPSPQCHIIFPLFSFCVCCLWFTISCSPPSESLEQATRYRNIITHSSTCIYNVLTVFWFPEKVIIVCILPLFAMKGCQFEPHYPKSSSPLPPNLTLWA